MSETFRGDFFRREFKNLGTVRSLIPSNVHMMVMTATATTSTKENVISILGLINPTLIMASPDKHNISYSVYEKQSIECIFEPLVKRLQEYRCKMPRVIVFCRRCEECAELYDFFFSCLKSEFVEPVGAPNLAMFRLVDMYTSVTRKSVKDSIIASFAKPDTPLRIVICTIAFGMGIDCVDVQQVIHWGPSADIESYVQECGRAGRNGLPSNAVLYWKKADFRRQTVSKEMELYCTNHGVCRRSMLMSFFDCTFVSCAGCSCCDLCAINCQCCKCNGIGI